MSEGPRLAAIEARLDRIEAKLDKAVARMDRRLPRWWQVPAVIVATSAAIGIVLTVAKRLGF
ncbi:MAG: hypothetical protein K2X11_13535 [Acetobacteraceae bacterium]|nr:hypothetical protein [Acetobacteraceae bacterium]